MEQLDKNKNSLWIDFVKACVTYTHFSFHANFRYYRCLGRALTTKYFTTCSAMVLKKYFK